MLITHRSALFIHGGLCEHGAQLAFSGAGALTGRSARAAFGFRLHHKDLGAVHLDVQITNRRASNHRQMKLLRAPDVRLLPGFHVLADRFRDSLDSFGSDF